MTDEPKGDERERKSRVRTKQFAAILTTYGYALLGGAALEPLTKHQPMSPLNFLLGFLGMAIQGWALYIGPRGEPK